jgi:toluene monooxygenase system ferredoxin subunit
MASEDEVEVGPADELWEGEMLEVALPGDRSAIVLNVGGEIVAYDGACPHQGSPLGELGYLDGDTFTCSAHMWEFSAATGQGINPREACLRTLPVVVRDGTIYVSAASEVVQQGCS